MGKLWSSEYVMTTTILWWQRGVRKLLVFIKVGLPSIRERWKLWLVVKVQEKCLKPTRNSISYSSLPFMFTFKARQLLFSCLPSYKIHPSSTIPTKCIFFGIYLLFLSLLEHIIFFVKVFVLFVEIFKDVILQDLQRDGRIFLLRAAVLQPHRALAADSNLVFESGNLDFSLFM